jgi:uncharacterized protein (DUF302 family)
MESTSGRGITGQQSGYSLDETVQRLKDLIAARGLKLFAVIDHSGEAEAAGLSMRPTKLLIFGSPKAGTPLMIASPSIALDLPLKLLVAEDSAGDVWTYSNSAAYLQERHGFPAEYLPIVAGADALAAQAAS